MRALLLSLALLASSCAGTCSAIGGGAIGHGAIGGGVIGCGAIGGCAAVVGGDAPTPPGDPSLWFSAANIDGQNNATLSDGDPVCTWVDLGSLGVNATQGTSSACPTYDADGGPGGGPALVFDGGDYLTTGLAAFGALAQPNMNAALALRTGASGSASLVVDGDTSARRASITKASDNDWYLSGGTGLNSGIESALNQWDSLVATYNGASSVMRVSGVAGTTGDGGSHEPRGLCIGSSHTGGANWVGAIADVLVYDTPPDPTDVEDYFEAACGCTFPVAP